MEYYLVRTVRKRKGRRYGKYKKVYAKSREEAALKHALKMY